MNELRQLAHFICTFQLGSVPEKVCAAARFCVLDSIGSALGAAHNAEIPDMCQTFKDWTGLNVPLSSDVWGQNFRLNPMAALLLNGCMAHALELDDVHTASKSHIGAVVVTTAWTLADALKSTGKEFLESVIVGYEVMCRIGMGMDVASNRKRGWHTTGLIGTFGSAAVACRLLKLNEQEIISALGMAGSQSAGLWAFLAEGATCKKLSPARASVNGLTAALLAKSGMTGPEHILDAKDGGLYAAVSDHYDMSKVVDGLGKQYEILNIDKKPYPCCRSTHHAIDAALTLRKKYHIDPSKIAHILVETYDVGVLQCGFTHYPASYVEAKFSIPYTCAVAFISGRVTLNEFKGEMLNNPLVKKIASNIKVVSDKMFTERYPKRWGSRMTVTMEDGSVLIQQVDDMSGSVARPLTAEQEMSKFEGLAGECINPERISQLMETILKIEEQKRLPFLSE